MAVEYLVILTLSKPQLSSLSEVDCLCVQRNLVLAVKAAEGNGIVVVFQS